MRFIRFLAATSSCERKFPVFLHADRVSVPIQNVIAINPKTEDAADSLSQGDAIISASSEPQRQSFTVVYAGRSDHSSNRNKWRYKSITFSSSDAHVVRLWIDTLQQAINGEIIFRLKNKDQFECRRRVPIATVANSLLTCENHSKNPKKAKPETIQYASCRCDRLHIPQTDECTP